ncbi:MAG TPA: flagellar protein FliS, partial [Chromatiales bacterium]|nr:flagellar protein FliS [Chromatiales bacterium]
MTNLSRRLMEVSRDNDLAKLDEVTSLILEVKSA